MNKDRFEKLSPDTQAKVRKIITANLPLMTKAMQDEEEDLTKKFADGGMTITKESPEEIDAAVKDVRATLESGSLEEVKGKTEALTAVMTKASEALYAQAQSEAEAAPNGDGDGSASADDEEIVDAEVVDEEK